MRQGGDPRLPLELALVKVTRPAADLERESIAYRLEQLEQHAAHGSAAPLRPSHELCSQGQETVEPAAAPMRLAERAAVASSSRSSRRPGSGRSCPPSSRSRSRPPRCSARRIRRSSTSDRLTVEFPAAASFHRQLAEEPKNATLLADALYEVTGRKLALDFAVGENGGDERPRDEEPAGEDQIVQLMKDSFDAREVEEPVMEWT